jgi:hypothetical protein
LIGQRRQTGPHEADTNGDKYYRQHGHKEKENSSICSHDWRLAEKCRIVAIYALFRKGIVAAKALA